jgi:hypothetical protein
MGTAVGNTTFVLGRQQDGNLETRTFENGQEYDAGLTPDLIQAYTADNTTFPYPA